jgi:hypothetical protein
MSGARVTHIRLRELRRGPLTIARTIPIIPVGVPTGLNAPGRHYPASG